MAISTDSALPENRVKISEDFRSLDVPTGEQVLGCVGDAWVRRVWFDMPRYCDGTDLSGYALSVNYRNAGEDEDEGEDRYTVSDAVVGTDTITFSWLVGAVACAAPGLTSVSIKAQKMNGDTVEREFNSTLYYFKVLPANTTGAAPIQEYSDAFTTLMLQWQAQVDTAVAEAPKGKLIGTVDSVQTVTDAYPTTMEGATLYGKSVQDGTPTPDNPVPVQVVSGKNLLSGNTQSSTIDSAGNFYPNTVLDLPAGTYTFSFQTELTSGAWQFLYRPDEASSWINTGTRQIAQNTSITFTTDIVIHQAYAYCNTGGTFTSIQLEKGTQTTPYTPYGSIGLQIGETVTPIDLQGHTLASLPDGTRDELDIDAAGVNKIAQRVGIRQFDGTETWLKDTSVSSRVQFYCTDNTVNRVADYRQAMLCDMLEVAQNSYIPNMPAYAITAYHNQQGRYPGQNWWYIHIDGITDVAILKTWLAEHTPTVYYELATPQTIELGTITPPDIAPGDTLAIYASLDPEWAIKYEQDPNIVVNALQSSIAPVEGSTASTNYAVNSYLIHANQLYRVTSAIATGEAITPGTNCVACTVMGEVKRLTA